MKPSDGVPQLIDVDERSKRQTAELCGDEQQGMRCMLVKGHPGMHESLAITGPAQWLSARAS